VLAVDPRDGWIDASAAAAVEGPPVLQFAADGRWESAAVLEAGAAPEAVRAAAHALATRARQDIAAELFWPDQGFVGARWNRTEAEALADAVCSAAAGGVQDRHRAALVGLCRLAGADRLGQCDLLEVGVVNEWRSAVPVRLWDRDQGAQPPDQMVSQLDAREDLMDGRRPLALEIATSSPRPLWLGVYITTSRGSLHVLDRRKLIELVRKTGPRQGG
jgi:hypothetical protein